MNVLLIPSSFPTQREPWPGSYIYEYARSLALQHDVTVVYPQQLGRPEVGDKPFFIEEWIQPRIRLVNYTYTHLPRSWALSYISAFRKIRRRIKGEWKIDVIFAHVVMPAGVAAFTLGRLFNIPVILTEHWGPARDWLKDPSLPSGVISAILKNTYRRVDYLTAVSSSLAEEIKTVFGAATDGKIDYPLDCNLFYPDETQRAVNPRRILCVTRGQPDSRKGVDNLLSAWQMVSRQTKGSVILDILGPDLELLNPQIEALGITQSVELHPWVPAAEVASFMRRASLIVIPSRYETFARSGIEALACGTPVVSTMCGGPNEYISEGNGLLVPVEDGAALAEGMMTGLNSVNFAPPRQLAEDIKKRFSYEVICNRFTEVSTELIQKRNGNRPSA